MSNVLLKYLMLLLISRNVDSSSISKLIIQQRIFFDNKYSFGQKIKTRKRNYAVASRVIFYYAWSWPRAGNDALSPLLIAFTFYSRNVADKGWQGKTDRLSNNNAIKYGNETYIKPAFNSFSICNYHVTIHSIFICILMINSNMYFVKLVRSKVYRVNNWQWDFQINLHNIWKK